MLDACRVDKLCGWERAVRSTRVQRSLILCRGRGHIEEKAGDRELGDLGTQPHRCSAEINSAIIGRSCHVGGNAVIGEGTVLGDKTSLTDYTRA